MRVYKKYVFDISKLCVFQETFTFVERLISEINCSYYRILFKFEDSVYSNTMNGIDKIVQKFPSLSVYKQTKEMSSTIIVLSNYNQPYDEEVVTVIKEISQKIPRPFNIGYAQIVFDGIDWFKLNLPIEQTHSSWFQSVGMHSGNCIRIEKSIGFGSKYNPISVELDVTNPSNATEIFDDLPLLTELSETMGKPIRTNMYIQYSEAEQAENVKRQQAVSEIENEIQEVIKTRAFMPFKWHEANWSNLDGYVGNNYPSMSIKKALAMLAKKHGFQYLGGENKVYRYEKIDELHNRLFIEIVQGISSPTMRSSVTYQNFCLRATVTLPDFLPKCQTDIEQFAISLFAAIEFLDSKMLPKLKPIYGKTPDWYVYGKNG